MPGGEQRPRAAQDDHPAGVVGLGPQERVVELDQQAPVLGVPRVRSVEQDPHDGPVVVGLVLQELVLGHRSPRRGSGVLQRDARVRLRGTLPA